ncbi:transmembrane protein 223 [Bombyx mandarina]|uniref:Transmembrane protein 223 n=1 Tax=Bombyx mandarina TaxID=7092 RepID=A0A6J2JHV9_BOMMA|nr:transmembrane protein 223 [Bombyx mandarina]
MSIISYASTIVKRVSALRYPLKCKECINNVNKVSFSSSSVTARTIHDVNTNVAKDVILFKYENPSFYKYMNIFAGVQYAFWMYLGIFAFSTLKDAPVDKSKITEDTPWYRKINLGENKYKNTLGTLAVIIGAGSLTMIWMYTLRSVRYLVLHKGGKHVSLVTYAPFGRNRSMKVPIEDICCQERRTVAKVQLPLKVRNRMMHYMLDMRGEFKNPLLFDCTAGLLRKWGKS